MLLKHHSRQCPCVDLEIGSSSDSSISHLMALVQIALAITIHCIKFVLTSFWLYSAGNVNVIVSLADDVRGLQVY